MDPSPVLTSSGMDLVPKTTVVLETSNDCPGIATVPAAIPGGCDIAVVSKDPEAVGARHATRPPPLMEDVVRAFFKSNGYRDGEKDDSQAKTSESVEWISTLKGDGGFGFVTLVEAVPKRKETPFLLETEIPGVTRPARFILKTIDPKYQAVNTTEHKVLKKVFNKKDLDNELLVWNLFSIREILGGFIFTQTLDWRITPSLARFYGYSAIMDALHSPSDKAKTESSRSKLKQKCQYRRTALYCLEEALKKRGGHARQIYETGDSGTPVFFIAMEFCGLSVSEAMKRSSIKNPAPDSIRVVTSERNAADLAPTPLRTLPLPHNALEPSAKKDFETALDEGDANTAWTVLIDRKNHSRVVLNPLSTLLSENKGWEPFAIQRNYVVTKEGVKYRTEKYALYLKPSINRDVTFHVNVMVQTAQALAAIAESYAAFHGDLKVGNVTVERAERPAWVHYRVPNRHLGLPPLIKCVCEKEKPFSKASQGAALWKQAENDGDFLDFWLFTAYNVRLIDAGTVMIPGNKTHFAGQKIPKKKTVRRIVRSARGRHPCGIRYKACKPDNGVGCDCKTEKRTTPRPVPRLSRRPTQGGNLHNTSVCDLNYVIMGLSTGLADTDSNLPMVFLDEEIYDDTDFKEEEEQAGHRLRRSNRRRSGLIHSHKDLLTTAGISTMNRKVLKEDEYDEEESDEAEEDDGAYEEEGAEEVKMEVEEHPTDSLPLPGDFRYATKTSMWDGSVKRKFMKDSFGVKEMLCLLESFIYPMNETRMTVNNLVFMVRNLAAIKPTGAIVRLKAPAGSEGCASYSFFNPITTRTTSWVHPSKEPIKLAEMRNGIIGWEINTSPTYCAEGYE